VFENALISIALQALFMFVSNFQRIEVAQNHRFVAFPRAFRALFVDQTEITAFKPFKPKCAYII